MKRPDPTQKSLPDAHALLQALSKHEVVWLLAGSYVLTLYGAEIQPNDLDVVVRRDPANLKRLARCLDDIDAVPFWTGDPKWDYGTPEDHLAWKPEPAAIEHLDRLFVTRHGMLDIPFALIPDYADLIGNCTRLTVAEHSIHVCDPRAVLVALEPRRRAKDRARSAEYAMLRVKFGLPPTF